MQCLYILLTPKSVQYCVGFFSTLRLFHGTVSYIIHAGVDPAYQSRGYGSTCLRFGIEEADQKSASVALISSNPRNISFYERHGFKAMSTKISAGAIVTGMMRPMEQKIDVSLTKDDGDDKRVATGGEGVEEGGEGVEERLTSATTEVTKSKED